MGRGPGCRSLACLQMRHFNRGADAADEAAALSPGTPAQRPELQKLAGPNS
jgi:hypothetical protein